jgi:hypothetical protein
LFTKSDPDDIELLKNQEKLLTQKASLVVSISKTMSTHLKRYNKDVHIVPQGFSVDDFKKPKKIKLDYPKNKKIVGYVGGINNRLDYDLLVPLVKENNDWHFIFWGPIQHELIRKSSNLNMQIKKLLSLDNVTHGKSTDKSEVAYIISKFNVAIIPYDSSQDFNKYSYPMKIFEYFYMGKPVLSTPIKELKKFPEFIKFKTTKTGWEKEIKNILSRRWSKNKMKKQKNIALENSWDDKLKNISELLKV